MGINKIFLTGFAAKDVEKRFTPNGLAVANLVLGVNTGAKESNAVQFVKCVAWRTIADTMEQTIKKGDNVLVEGKLITNSFVDKEGNRKRTIEVEVSSITPFSQQAAGGRDNASSSSPDDTFEELFPSDTNSDEMPF